MQQIKHFLLTPIAALSLLGLAAGAHAIDYVESVDGNAGNSLATAGDTTLLTGTIDNIRGSINNGVDLFKIYIADFSTFAASTNNAGTDAGLDTQLFLFDSTGKGIAANDDITTTNTKSILPAGNGHYAAKTPGIYYLGISAYDRDPQSAGGAIFGNAKTGVVGATGPGGAGTLTGWSGSSASTGSYRIRLTGVVGAVPEPGAVATAIAFGGALGGLMLRKQRKA